MQKDHEHLLVVEVELELDYLEVEEIGDFQNNGITLEPKVITLHQEL
jgi:hypothetical protein